MTGSWRALVAPCLLVLLLWGCGDRPSWAREKLGRAYFDSTGTYMHAGVSTRIQTPPRPLEISSLHGDTLGQGFQLFQMRCAGCHEPPDPGLKTDQDWRSLVERMQEKTKSAGLMPMTDTEADTILGFLERHARR